MKWRVMLAVLVCAAAFLWPGAAQAESEQVFFRINDKGYGGSSEMGFVYISDSGRTMMPLGLVSDGLGFTAKEDDGKIHIFNETEGVDLWLEVGSRSYTFNNKKGRFKTAPLERDGHVYLPVRDIGKLFGSVYWDGATRVVWLYCDDAPLYDVIGDKLLRADEDGIHKAALPKGFDLEGVFDQPIPLFRVEDDGTLTYLCDVPVSGGFAVDGERLYTTANMNAGGWNSAYNDPTTLYVTTLGDAPTTTTYHMNFEIVRCQLQIDGNDLIATNGDERHVIALNALEAFEAMQ